MNHKISTIVLITALLIGVALIATGLTSEEIDEVCPNNNNILLRINGTWQCANPTMLNYTFYNITANSIQCPSGEYLYNVSIDELGDLTGVCSTPTGTGGGSGSGSNQTLTIANKCDGTCDTFININYLG